MLKLSLAAARRVGGGAPFDQTDPGPHSHTAAASNPKLLAAASAVTTAATDKTASPMQTVAWPPVLPLRASAAVASDERTLEETETAATREEV